jgi:hypothetical protein
MVKRRPGPGVKSLRTSQRSMSADVVSIFHAVWGVCGTTSSTVMARTAGSSVMVIRVKLLLNGY